METAKVLNKLFTNVVQNLNTKYPRHLSLEAVLEYRKYSSIIAIESKFRCVSTFSF